MITFENVWEQDTNLVVYAKDGKLVIEMVYKVRGNERVVDAQIVLDPTQVCCDIENGKCLKW